MNPNSFYIVPMFPYPSGRLHMGHVRNYAITDAIARHYRRQGKRVLHPMGWDAYGLPAENAARENGVDPRQWTDQNIQAMREQLRALRFDFDWSNEIATHDPAYTAIGQSLFIRFYQAGLIERREGVVSWDPVDQTVLANEQVIDGRGWRSGAVVEQKTLSMLFARVSDEAWSLHEGLQQVNWPSQAIAAQKAWIGYDETEQSFRVRDWCLSRQRSWGTPVPLVECAECGEVPAGIHQLPLTNLPTHASEHDRAIECPCCHGPALRSSETLDTFWDSSFYTYVYPTVATGQKPGVSSQQVNRYVGGIEHATMHLLYARWFARALKKVGMEVAIEPFPSLITQGMVCAPAWKTQAGQWIAPEERWKEGEAWVGPDGTPVECVGSIKMSKSRKNGIDPASEVRRYGAEAVRFAMLFAAPFMQDVDWSETVVPTAARHLEKIQAQAIVIAQAPAGNSDTAMEQKIAQLRRKTVQSFEGNEGVNAMMGMALGVWRDAVACARAGQGDMAREAACAVVDALWPIAPRAMEQAMRVINPQWTPQAVKCTEEMISRPTVIQINGVRRGQFDHSFQTQEEVMEWMDQHHPEFKEMFFPQGVERVIWVPGKIFNVVAKKPGLRMK